MQRHRVKVSFIGIVGNVDELAARVRVDGDLGVDLTRVGRCNHQRRPFEMVAAIRLADDRHLSHSLRILELGSRQRRDDSHRRTSFYQRQCFARPYSAATDHHCGDTLSVQGDGEVAHRNCPRFSDAMRNTTYNAMTLAKVTADIRAARRACQPLSNRPNTSALTPSQAAIPQMVCRLTPARQSNEEAWARQTASGTTQNPPISAR